MNRKLFTITLITLLALLVSVGGAAGQGPRPEERAGPLAAGTQPQAKVSITAAVNSRISYQGLLEEGGNPVTGSRDMTFRFYSDDVCATQVGSDTVKSGVTVTQGLFSVKLDVAHDDFDGQGLWLEVEVGGDVIGCQEVMPVPYALSLRPGAKIVGNQPEASLYAQNDNSANYTSGVYGYATAASGRTRGVYGQTDSSSNWASGVYGYASATDGLRTHGVYGVSDSLVGRGVAGHASSTSGHTVGVYGSSDSTEGCGLYGWATATSGRTMGLRARTDSSTGWSAGVYGEATANSGATIGVRGRSASSSEGAKGVYGYTSAISGTVSGVVGRSDSASGRGVYGYAHATSGQTYGVYGRSVSSSTGASGVYGRASTSSGVTYGVRGQSDSPDGYGVYATNTAGGYAGYFDGDVHIVGERAGSSLLTVENSSSANDSRAIRGYASAATGFTAGVNGRTDSSSTGAKGVWGYAAGGGQTYGVHGESNSTSGRGVYGRANASSGTNYGVYGESGSTSGRGMYGVATATSGATYGVYGQSDSTSGRGVLGYATASSGTTYGVLGQSNSPDGYGVYGQNMANGYAGYFSGHGYFSGDVAQGRAADGLVKAAVYATCDEFSGGIDRHFNNVAGTVTLTSVQNGICTLDFDFQVNDRFWSVTVPSSVSADSFAKCAPHSTHNDRLVCYHFYNGSASSGDIMVLIH